MVHEGRCKHPALHLRYHLQVRLNTAPGRPAQYTVPASVIQAVCIAPHRTAIPISRSDTLDTRPPVWYTRLIFPLAGPAWMFATLRASAATGQIDPRPRLWCTTAPFVPFFVCAIHIVALSACNSITNPAECEMRCPSLVHRRISQSRNGMVRFFRGVAGDVYSPTRRR
jgi:hypothetical protein